MAEVAQVCSIVRLEIISRYCQLSSFTSNKKEVNAFARVCLSVCLLARLNLFKIACTDLDEMLRVDRYRDMDELINFWALSGL